jgi:hypothetical protein
MGARQKRDSDRPAKRGVRELAGCLKSKVPFPGFRKEKKAATCASPKPRPY